ncbi:MAG: serpin family protein [Clostridiaceae bacterium]|jgi:serine protease inhibitor|nr:serpin family protein [Clostridiaceae bacterium]
MRRFLVFFLVLSLLMISAACSTQPAFDSVNVSSYVVDGNNQFAFDIFKTLNTEDTDKNIFISPLSISSALTMTYNGAEGYTKEAMEDTLGFKGIDRALVNESFKNLFAHIKKLDKKIELNIANSIWIRKGQQINKDFINNNEQKFNARVSSLDFSDPASADIINKWINEETRGKIEKMVSPPIDPGVVMYLINAIYFKGKWTNQFNPNNTRDWIFQSYDEGEQTVEMMSRKDEYEFIRGKDFKAIRLPYGNGKTSMNIILPDEGVDINEFINKFDRKDWYSIRSSLKETEDVEVKIPKFKMEYGIKNLNDSLKSLGMEDAFSGNADFSGLSSGLFISSVTHKAVIEVNEEGSEAAAATVVAMLSAAVQKEPITFIADRPFIFLITEDITGTILFMGKVLSI